MTRNLAKRGRSRLSLVSAVAAAVFTTVIASATALAATSARPTPGHYAGPTSEQDWSLGTRGCLADFGKMGCEVTFKVADHGKRVTGFTAADGYNHLCHFTTAN